MNGYYSKQPRFWRGLSLAIGLTGVLLWPSAAIAQDRELERTKQESTQPEGASSASRQEQPLSWARIDYILNDVELVPRRARARTARIADVLGIGDALRTLAAGNAELRFNDGSEVRIGELATFRFTPNTRNFQLSDGTALFLIPPKRGRTTIQTPNAVTGIQGSALFVRYIEETDTTIVGALTDNPDGPMILYTEDGAQRQALYSNQVGVVEGDRITEVYDLDAQMFWETSGLAETFDYTEDAGSTDELDGVRQEIRDAIDSQEEFDGGNVVENPPNFSRPGEDQAAADELDKDATERPTDGAGEEDSESSDIEGGNEDDSTSGSGSSEEETDLTINVEDADETGEEIQYEGSPAEEFHNQNKRPDPSENGSNQSPSAAFREAENEDEEETASASNGNAAGRNTPRSGGNASSSGGSSRPNANRPEGANEQSESPGNSTAVDTTDDELVIEDPELPVVPDDETPEVLAPPSVAGGNNGPNRTPVARPGEQTEGVDPLRPVALTEDGETEDEENPMTGENSDSEEESPTEGNNDSNDDLSSEENGSDGNDSLEGGNGDGASEGLEGSDGSDPLESGNGDDASDNGDDAEAVPTDPTTNEGSSSDVPEASDSSNDDPSIDANDSDDSLIIEDTDDSLIIDDANDSDDSLIIDDIGDSDDSLTIDDTDNSLVIDDTGDSDDSLIIEDTGNSDDSLTIDGTGDVDDSLTIDDPGEMDATLNNAEEDNSVGIEGSDLGEDVGAVPDEDPNVEIEIPAEELTESELEVPVTETTDTVDDNLEAPELPEDELPPSSATELESFEATDDLVSDPGADEFIADEIPVGEENLEEIPLLEEPGISTVNESIETPVEAVEAGMMEMMEMEEEEPINAGETNVGEANVEEATLNNVR